MLLVRVLRGHLAALLLLVLGTGAIAQTAGGGTGRFEEEKRSANANTVAIVASSASSTYTRLVQDIQDVLDDNSVGEGLRVLPVLGKGGGQNFHDILFLRSIDMGTTDVAYMQNYKQKDPVLYANIEQRVQYICKVLDSEFHMLASKDIKSYADLKGKKVSFWKKLSITSLAAETIFKTLGIDVEPVYLDNDAAIEELRSGKIAAIARMSGAPHDDYDRVRVEDGFHLLPLDEDASSPAAYNKLLTTYLPAQLTNKHYPQLISAGQAVPTVASGIVLAVYNWPVGSERYVKLANFVQRFFDNIDKFHNPARHPKWKEVNLAAEVPGWIRFKPAQDWLDANVKNKGMPVGMQVAFERFIENYGQKSARTIAKPEREALFNDFSKWWQAQKPNSE
jgi:TRAP-type uncharacterized transport system substrate-binding protein